MSLEICNQKNNLKDNNIDIEMKEPNVTNMTLSVMKKEIKLNFNPNDLQIELFKQFNQNNNFFSSKIKIQENTIQQIVSGIDQLTQKLIKFFEDCKEKFSDIDEKIINCANNINQNVNNTNSNTQTLYENILKLKKEKDSFNNSINEAVQAIINNLNILEEKQKELGKMKEKVDIIEKILKENDIKLEIKNDQKNEYNDIDIKEYAKNLDNKILKYKIIQKYNTIMFKDITKESEEKENEMAEKFKIILKKDNNTEKGITYAVSKKSKEWDFSRHMKNIMKRLKSSRINKKINFKNLNYVFKLIWTDSQIQFIKISATPKYINNNQFFVKVGNNMIFVKYRRRIRSNTNFSNVVIKDKNKNNYNKNIIQNLSGILNNENNRNKRNNKKIKNNKNGNNIKNKRFFNNNKRFNPIRKFNKVNYNNNNKNANNQVIKLLPKILNIWSKGQNF